MATIYEVSELAGVSLATVSRVMNESGRVSDKTRQKVLSAMEQLDYRPNSIAQSLASNRSNSVGILVPELYGPFFGTMISGIEEELRQAGKHVIVTVGHRDEAKEKEGIEFLAGRRCDALIVHVDAVSDEYLAELCRGRIPVVVMNRLVPELTENCISIDNEHGGYIATRYLLEQGHRQVAYIAGPLWKRDATERLDGHKRALAESGVEFDEALMFEGDFHESSGSDGMSYLLRRDSEFSAVACANDSMAAGAMKIAREAGLKVPEDVSIIGFDNVIFARYMYPELSTVNFPVGEMGQMAARWILKNVYDKVDLRVQNLFEPSLVIRDSVANGTQPLSPVAEGRSLRNR